MRITASGATFGDTNHGFTVNALGSNLAGVLFDTPVSDVRVEGNAIHGPTGSGNALANHGGIVLTDVTIENNDFFGGQQQVYTNTLASNNVDIFNNTFNGDVGNGVLLGIEFSNGEVYGNVFDGASIYAALEFWGANNDVVGPGGEMNDLTDFVGPIDIRTAQDDIDLKDFIGADTALAQDGTIIGIPQQGIDLTGTDEANTLTGHDQVNVLTEKGGDDTLNGMGGDDSLNGGDDDDTLDGGTGTDTAMGYSAAAVVSFNGTNWVVTDGADVDTLIDMENVITADGTVPARRRRRLVHHHPGCDQRGQSGRYHPGRSGHLYRGRGGRQGCDHPWRLRRRCRQ